MDPEALREKVAWVFEKSTQRILFYKPKIGGVQKEYFAIHRTGIRQFVVEVSIDTKKLFRVNQFDTNAANVTDHQIGRHTIVYPSKNTICYTRRYKGLLTHAKLYETKVCAIWEGECFSQERIVFPHGKGK